MTSRHLVRCPFCDWQRILAEGDHAVEVTADYATHIQDHVPDMIRTALLPYDDDVFIPEPAMNRDPQA